MTPRNPDPIESLVLPLKPESLQCVHVCIPLVPTRLDPGDHREPPAPLSRLS